MKPRERFVRLQSWFTARRGRTYWQGIAVIDKQMRLVAWNQRYLELFGISYGLIQVGRPISDVIRHNAEQGLCGPGDPEIMFDVVSITLSKAHDTPHLVFVLMVE